MKSDKSKRRYFFFFKQKAAYEVLTCDWSSGVCSSDLSKKSGGAAAAKIGKYKKCGRCHNEKWVV